MKSAGKSAMIDNSIQAPSASGPGDKHGALHGIRVVELTSAIVGPLAGSILGDMGADVIKVEPPEGDNTRLNGHARHPGMAAMFLGINRNKRSVVLDLKTEVGREALMRLLKTADVFVSSMRRSALERMGFGYAAVAAQNPGIIYATAPGYRSDGPFSARPAYDDIIQGHAGVAGMIEKANGEARYMPTDMSGKVCGHILASAIAMALYARAQTGEGQEVEVPMMESTVAFMLWEHLWGASFDPPIGPIGYNRLFTQHRKPLQTLDGYICLLMITDEQWRRMFLVLGRPDLCVDPRFATLDQRTTHVDVLYDTVAEEISQRPSAEWVRRLEEADLPYARMNRIEELPEDPYLKETGFFETYDHPTEGSLVRTPITIFFSDTPASIRLPPRTLGQDTAKVLAELGYDEAQAADLGRPR